MNRTNIRNSYTFVIKSGIIREAIRETAESGQTNRLDLQTEHTEGDKSENKAEIETHLNKGT